MSTSWLKVYIDYYQNTKTSCAVLALEIAFESTYFSFHQSVCGPWGQADNLGANSSRASFKTAF